MRASLPAEPNQEAGGHTTDIAGTMDVVGTITGYGAQIWYRFDRRLTNQNDDIQFPSYSFETENLGPSPMRTTNKSRVASGRHEAKSAPSEAAARLMSETAHDLRSPLTTVRESLRLVHDGHLGGVSVDQQDCLGAAIDQCDCMDQMIGEMVQLERLRTGTPRVNRRWVPVSQIRQAVDETLRPWAMPREIDVMWDGVDEVAKSVFADPAMLRRLLVNLVTNSIRATAEGGGVLVRLQKVSDGDAIRWSVLDQGRGISESDLQRIADREVTFDGGEGLGLAISRQLAALHFSPLQIRSRLGCGTQVSFETAAAGPRSVAQTWANWRVARRGAQEPMKDERSHHYTTQTARQIRLDPPLLEIEVTHEASVPRCEDRLAAGTVTVGATVSRETADAFDGLLQSQLQMFDLVYRVNQRRWVWAFDVDAHAVRDRIDAITDAVQARIPNVRMSWSDAQMIPVDERKTHTRLSDLMVRESLSASASTHVLDKNEVRLGTPPIVPSEIAEDRLDAELRRLSNKLQSQTATLQQQARKLRPRE